MATFIQVGKIRINVDNIVYTEETIVTRSIKGSLTKIPTLRVVFGTAPESEWDLDFEGTDRFVVNEKISQLLAD